MMLTRAVASQSSRSTGGLLAARSMAMGLFSRSRNYTSSTANQRNEDKGRQTPRPPARAKLAQQSSKVGRAAAPELDLDPKLPHVPPMKEMGLRDGKHPAEWNAVHEELLGYGANPMFFDVEDRRIRAEDDREAWAFNNIPAPKAKDTRRREPLQDRQVAMVNRLYESKPMGFPHRIRVGVLVERPQVITQELLEWEKEYEEFQRSVDEYPGNTMPTLIQAYKAVGPELVIERTVNRRRKERMVEIYEPAPRDTEADRKGDQTTQWRKLDQMLYLFVKQKDGTVTLPAIDYIPGKELHIVARECMREHFGEDFYDNVKRLWYMSPAPDAMLQHDFKNADKDGYTGIKTFILRARLVDVRRHFPSTSKPVGGEEAAGTVRDPSNPLWLTRQELQETLDASLWSELEPSLLTTRITAGIGRSLAPEPYGEREKTAEELRAENIERNKLLAELRKKMSKKTGKQQKGKKK
eukprot:Clim_evm15s8 gene=Clim_evmTU15s8